MFKKKTKVVNSFVYRGFSVDILRDESDGDWHDYYEVRKENGISTDYSQPLIMSSPTVWEEERTSRRSIELEIDDYIWKSYLVV